MGEQLTRQRSSSSRLQETVWDPCMAQLVSFAYRPDMFPQEMDWINFSFVIRWILTNVKTVQWFFDGHLSVFFFFSNWSRFPLLGVYFKLQKKSVPYPTISCFIPKNVTEWTEVIRATLRHNTTQLLYWESSSFMSIYVPQQKSIHCWYFQLLFYFFFLTTGFSIISDDISCFSPSWVQLCVLFLAVPRADGRKWASV